MSNVPPSRWKKYALLGVLALLVALSFKQRWPGGNLNVLQADAWLHGRMDIPLGSEDASVYGGKAWVPFPPFPSVVVLPFVAVLGPERVPMRLLSTLLALLAGWSLLRVLRRLELAPTDQGWMLAAFLLGTGLWSCALWSSGVWFFAHVVAATCLLLAVAESLGKGRAALVGLFAGGAFLSRQLAVYSLLFLVAVLWRRAAEGGRRRQVLQVGTALAAFGVCALVYLAYNAARFGNPFDTGYAYIPLDGHLQARVERYGLFHAAYVPFNFIHMFLEGPHFNFQPPRLLRPWDVNGFGTSLTVASPFVFLALAARDGGGLVPVRAAWATVGLAATHMLFYYNNGWIQLNAHRFTLDFLPVLMVLVALGVKQRPEGRWKPLVAWAVGLNAFVLALMPHLTRWLGRL